METPTLHLVLGSVLILVATACGGTTIGETTSTPVIEPAVTQSTTNATTVTTTSAPVETTTTAAPYEDYGPQEDEVPTATVPTSTTSVTATTQATSTTSTTATTQTTSTTSPASTTTVDETKTVSVSIVNFRFESASVTINVGDTIRWTVNSGTHTTTSSTNIWDSYSKATGEVFSHTFTEAGSFSYFCSIHPSMQATITVE